MKKRQWNISKSYWILDVACGSTSRANADCKTFSMVLCGEVVPLAWLSITPKSSPMWINWKCDTITRMLT